MTEAAERPAATRTRLYRVVETVRLGDRSLRAFGPIWEPTLERAKRAAARLASSPLRLRLHIEDSAGRVLERLSPPR